jgi:putative ABC transport system permease protein
VNLAWKDIRLNRTRFVLTALGVGAIICATIGLIALYRGIVHESLLMIFEGEADLWVVQGNTTGPFTEPSRVSGTLDRRIEGVPGVKRVRRFLQFSKQFSFSNHRVQLAITGLDFPKDNGVWLPLLTGRYLSKSHYEAIADISTGLAIGERIRLGPDEYTVVGITKGQVDMSGDGLLYVTVADAIAIESHTTSENVLLRRTTRGQPENWSQSQEVAAILVTVFPGVDIERVRNTIANWGDVRVFTQSEQIGVVVEGRLRKLRLQLLGFVFVLLLVTGTIVSLSIYTSVLEKLHYISLLKLMGARESVIISMILQYSLAIGTTGSFFAVVVSHLLFPLFPRTVMLFSSDITALIAAVLLVCVLASWFGAARAMRVRSQDILS